MFRDSPSPTEPHSRLRTFLEVLGVLLATGILLLAFVGNLREQERITPAQLNVQGPDLKSSDLDLSSYVGEEACAGCHPGETAAHSGSGHHRTLWPAGHGSLARKLDGQRLVDPELPGVEWSYHLRGKNLEVERLEQGVVQRMMLEFGVGSGNHGVSFVTTAPGAKPSADRVGIEHRFSYFVASQKLEITPGQERDEAVRLGLKLAAFGRDLSSEKARNCLDCHATLTSRKKLDHLDPPTLIPTVSCERCHGPGRDHIDAVKAGKEHDLKMPMTLLTEPTYQVEQCGECHRLPSSVDRSAIHPDNPGIVRFQSLGLSMSQCFENGMGTLKCTSCHDGHARTSRDRRGYEAVCLKCHESNGPRHTCPVSPKEECIRCHMPKRNIPGGFVFSDHWIRVPSPDGGDHRGGPPSSGNTPGSMH
jgi:hypothetical protein